MKRNQLKQVSIDDRRRRYLLNQLIKRRKEPVPEVIKWYDTLSNDDKKELIIGVQLGLLEMVNSTRTLAASIGPLLGAMVRDLELQTRGKEADHADDT